MMDRVYVVRSLLEANLPEKDQTPRPRHTV
jgi:hypothetical protein